MWAQLNISSNGVSSIYLFLVTHYPTTRNKMELLRPGGLYKRRLDGTLSVSYQIQSPLGGGLRNKMETVNGTEANVAGRSVRACDARKSKS